jgi:Phosphoribulokinase / Uridine kinase family
VVPAIVERDAFHRYDRETMQEKMIDMQRHGYANFSHFGPDSNLFEELEALFRQYGECGSGKVRRYLHNEEDARPHGLKAGMFTPWDDLPAGSDVLFYEGPHGAVKTAKVNIARHADLLIGIVPSINLEWIQKMHRDKSARGQTQEAIVETILRRMPTPSVRSSPRRRSIFSACRSSTHPTRSPRGISQARRKHAGDPLPRSERRRFSLSALDAQRELHVESEYHRLPWRQDAARHAADLYPHDLAVDGTPAEGVNGPATARRGPDATVGKAGRSGEI